MFETLAAVALGISLSACCGFRVFVPFLIVGLAGRFVGVSIAENLAWTSSTPALIILTVAVIVEMSAFYVPLIDHALDTVKVPLAVIAGTILTSSELPIDSEIVKYVIAAISGGVCAGSLSLGIATIRAVSSVSTFGIGNIGVSTGENTAAVAGTILAFIVPVIMAILFILLSIFGLWFFVKMMKRLYRKNHAAA